MRRSPLFAFSVFVSLCAVAASLSRQVPAEPPPVPAAVPSALLPVSVVSVEHLVQQSEYIGIITVARPSPDRRAAWRQHADVTASEPIKGILPPSGGAWPKFERVWGWSTIRTSAYPDWYTDTGEYLVFLRHGSNEGKTVWTTLAAFPVTYRSMQLSPRTRARNPLTPDKLTRCVGGSRYSFFTFFPVKSVVPLLEKINQDVGGGEGIKVKGKNISAEQALDRYFRAFQMNAVPRDGLAHESLYRLATRFVASLPPDLTRAEVGKIFPQKDGGISSPRQQRYYLGSEVMVEVTYALTGKGEKPGDRLVGKPKVYKSPMHVR